LSKVKEKILRPNHNPIWIKLEGWESYYSFNENYRNAFNIWLSIGIRINRRPYKNSLFNSYGSQ
jgi:hypothetical protein